jgi:hypothetical protein
MSRLLKYAIVLAPAVAIGAYIVLGPVSLEDIVPSHPEVKAAATHLQPTPPASPASIDEELDYMVAKRLASLEGWRAFLAAHGNGAYAQSATAEVERRLGAEKASAEPPATAPASASTDNEQGYGVAQGLESLASYAQSATAKAEQLLFADRAAAPGNTEVSTGASSDARAVSESTGPVSPPTGDAVPATAPVAVSNDASQDAKAVNEAARPAAPVAERVGAAGTQLAALAPDEICQRDRERLERLRSNPSSDELVRFANELSCKKLLPQVVSLMESLSPAAAHVSTAAPPDTQAANEAARPASPVAGADIASLTSDEACKRDGGRLARLRASPSGQQAQRFASELSCEALRPQLQRLMEGLGFVAPAPANSSLPSSSLLTEGCVSERAALDRLRKEPSAEAAGLFWRDLQCEGLRPQVRLLMESLNITPEPLSSVAEGRHGASSDARAANGADPVICRRETAELNRIRATPDLVDAKHFASAVTCNALKPQAARLLESLKE